MLSCIEDGDRVATHRDPPIGLEHAQLVLEIVVMVQTLLIEFLEVLLPRLLKLLLQQDQLLRRLYVLLQARILGGLRECFVHLSLGGPILKIRIDSAFDLFCVPLDYVLLLNAVEGRFELVQKEISAVVVVDGGLLLCDQLIVELYWVRYEVVWLILCLVVRNDGILKPEGVVVLDAHRHGYCGVETISERRCTVLYTGGFPRSDRTESCGVIKEVLLVITLDEIAYDLEILAVHVPLILFLPSAHVVGLDVPRHCNLV